MCLSKIDNTLIDKLPNKIKAWKVFVTDHNKLYSDTQHYHYRRGFNVCKTEESTVSKYTPRFHVFKSRRDARGWFQQGFVRRFIIVPVYINKKDVTDMGTQYIMDFVSRRYRNVVVIVTKRLTILKKDYNKALKK